MLTRLLRRVQTDHVMLFQVIETGDMEGVRAAMRKHIESTRKRVFKGWVPTGVGRGSSRGRTGLRVGGSLPIPIIRIWNQYIYNVLYQ